MGGCGFSKHDGRNSVADPSLSMATDCCIFPYDSALDEKGKKRSRSPFTFLTNKIKETASKHRSASSDRKEFRSLNSTNSGMMRTPDMTLAAGSAGNPMVTIRGPTPNMSFNSASDLLLDDGNSSPRVVFGMDDPTRTGTPNSSGMDMTPIDSNVFSLMSEFNYAIRIFPGQEAKCVFVGWVTSDFHQASNPFALSGVRKSEVRILDSSGQLKEHCLFRNSYLVCAADLQEQVNTQTTPEKQRSSSSATPGIVIGSSIDLATGRLTFSINGREVDERHQVQPNTKLYPAVFVEPTSKDVLQFEFVGTRTALPLTSAIFHRVRNLGALTSFQI